MSGTKYKERQLRQINITTEEVNAVSEYMTTASAPLMQTEDVSQELNITSPVMKKLNAIPVSIPSDAPTESEVIEAHNEVGLTLAANSKKHPKRVKRAAEKRDQQRNFAASRTAALNQISHLESLHEDRMRSMTAEEKEQYMLKRQSDAFDKFEQLNIEKLMFDKSGKTSYEKLEKNYAEIKKALTLIPLYGQEIKRRMQDPSLTDEQADKLKRSQAKLNTLYDIRAYYDVYEKLMLNKYYAMLPREEMHSLSYNELRLRLNKLYTASTRNEALIDYYQNLVRLRELGLTDGASVSERQTQYYTDLTETKEKEDTRDPKAELEEMSMAFEKLADHMNDESAFIPQQNQNLYYEKFFKLCQKDVDTFRTMVSNPGPEIKALLKKYDAWKLASASADSSIQDLIKAELPADETLLEKDDAQGVKGIALSSLQKRNINLIGSWIMRNSVLSYSQYPEFALNLLQTKPEQQLLVYYLIENEKQDSPIGIDFFTALNNYQPDLENFKKKVQVENLSRALRASMAIFGEMKNYGQLSEDIKESDAQIEKDKDPATVNKRPLTEQRKTLVKAVSQRGALLRMLYRNAGLHEDMPPDMAEDPILRKKLFQEYNAMLGLIGSLDTMNRQINDGTGVTADYHSDRLREDSEAVSEEEKADYMGTASEVMGGLKDYVFSGALAGVTGMTESLGDYSAAMRETSGYAHFSGWSGGLTAILGLATATITAVGIALETGISVADRTAQSLSVSSDFVDAAGALVSSIGTLGSAFVNTTESITTIGSTQSTVIGSTAVGETLAVAGGAATVIAGALKTASSGVELGRSISSRNDVKRARKTLETKDQDSLTKDERNVKNFLKHQDRTITKSEVSAGVGLVTGISSMVMGGLVVSGVLAPVAAVIGLGILAVDLGFGKIFEANRRHANRKKAVDDMLEIDKLLKKVRDTHPNREALKKVKDSALKDKIRTEALAMMGFSSYQECYRSLCMEYATTLYKKVFVENPPPADRDMYFDAMKSLGLKIVEPAVQGQEAKPSVETMVTKMMS